jgi:hypothetical protein
MNVEKELSTMYNCLQILNSYNFSKNSVRVY